MKLDERFLDTDLGKSLIECLDGYRNAMLYSNRYKIESYTNKLKSLFMIIGAKYDVTLIFYQDKSYYAIAVDGEPDYVIKIYKRGVMNMEMNASEFFNSEFGQSLIECLSSYDEAVLDGDYYYQDIYYRQLEVYISALKFMYGIEYRYIRSPGYYGLLPENSTDFLIKVNIRR